MVTMKIMVLMKMMDGLKRTSLRLITVTEIVSQSHPTLNPYWKWKGGSISQCSGVTHRPDRLCGGAEVELKNKPYVVKFKNGKAGAVYTNHKCVD